MNVYANGVESKIRNPKVFYCFSAEEEGCFYASPFARLSLCLDNSNI